jgi:uncharacterized phage-associated protein
MVDDGTIKRAVRGDLVAREICTDAEYILPWSQRSPCDGVPGDDACEHCSKRREVSILDAAKYILVKKGPISAFKLQKLCYYAQAWTLAWEDRPMFAEDFQAWVNGPVCTALYYYHQGEFIISANNIPSGNIKNLSVDDIENLDLVLDQFGDKNPYWLREQTCHEYPWLYARGDLEPDEESSAIITKGSIGAYYSSL